MAGFPNVEEILENEIEVCCAVEQSEMAPSQNIQLKELSLDIIESVCASLSQNCILHTARDFFKQASRTQLLDKLGFFNACLVKRTKLPHADREKSWGNFHEKHLENINVLNEVTGSPMISSWLALKSFERLLDINYPVINSSKELEKITAELSEEVIDIINYIGGIIIKKMKQRLLRCQESTSKEEQLGCLEKLTQEDDDMSSLTSTLNRDREVFLKPETKQFFHLLEKKILELFTQSVEKCTMANFQNICSQDTFITSVFSELTYEAEGADEIKEILFGGMVRLYFKIRDHHECRQYIEKQKVSAVFAKKSLWKSLQSSSK